MAGVAGHVEAVEPAHKGRKGQKQNIHRLTGGIEEHTGSQEHVVFPAPGQELVEHQRDGKKEEEKGDAGKEHETSSVS